MRLIDADELIKSLFKLPPHAFYATEYIKVLVIDAACRWEFPMLGPKFCPHCGAKMDGGTP